MYNPYGNVDLVAIGKASHPALIPADVTRIRVSIAAHRDGAEDLVAVLDPQSAHYETNFDIGDQLAAHEVGIPILGLYSDHRNQVDLEITSNVGSIHRHAPYRDARGHRARKRDRGCG